MGKSSGSKQRVTRYYLSMFWGICAATDGIQLLEIKIGDKIYWRGNATGNTAVGVDKMDLHGGDTKEGGASGVLWWLNGNPNQSLPAYLASKFGKTPTTTPGYRGIASFFMVGPKGPQFRGFYIGANNPYIKKITARVRRASIGLTPGNALIRVKDNSKGLPQYASNPIHIIYECMTNTDWGMGESPSMFDLASFNAAASVIFTEKLGLNLIWTRQSSIEEFVNIVLDHIQGALFINPTTGKHTIKLLRSDYVISDLKTVSPSNAKLSNFKTKTWAEVSNEIVVTWTNPETSKEETVTVQDLAAIAAKGGITSFSRNYHGIADRDTAIEVAERDLATLAYPLSSCKAEVTRAFFDAVNNGCVVLNWADYGIASSVYRITEVAKGSTSRTLTLTLMEDVFALQRTQYIGNEEREWTDPTTDPQPLSNVYLGTLPAFMTVNMLRLTNISNLAEPEALASVMAMRETPDDMEYDLYGYTADATGEMTLESVGDRMFTSGFNLPVALVPEATSTVDVSQVFGNMPRRGDFLQIGRGADANTEIAMVQSVSGTVLTISRGMLDTTPKTWGAGALALVYIRGSYTSDHTIRAAGETATYHFLPSTSRGKLPLADAPQHTITLSARPHLPNRPADVRVGGVDFGTFNMGGAASVEVTWKNRNRRMEATQAMRWTDANVNPEVGQTTMVRILSASDRSVLNTISGLTGQSVTLNRSDIPGNADVIVKVYAERDGYVSLQGHEIRVNL